MKLLISLLALSSVSSFAGTVHIYAPFFVKQKLVKILNANGVEVVRHDKSADQGFIVEDHNQSYWSLKSAVSNLDGDADPDAYIHKDKGVEGLALYIRSSIMP